MKHKDELQTMNDGLDIPKNIRKGLSTYLHYGSRPGSFLRAVLANDLYIASTRADPNSLKSLPDICRYVMNYMPEACYGSEAKVEVWMKKGGLEAYKPTTTRASKGDESE